MKGYVLTFMLLIAGFTFAGTPGKTTGISFGETTTGEIRTEMQVEQLPAGVVKTLDGAKFTGWKPVVVYKVENSSSTFYEITFVRDEEIINLRVNENGGKIG